jgi:type II secretory pathway pseudopilin PulG
LQASSAAHDARSAFTLLEVVIALSLSIILITAVYGAIRLHYRVSQSGRDQMERAQLGRAILQQIEADVRSIVWQVQEPPQSSQDDESTSAVEDDSFSSGSSSVDTSTTEMDDMQEMASADEAFTSGSSGLFGDSQNLVLHISRPSRDLVYASSLDGESDAFSRSDLASVSYFLADSNAGGLSAVVAQQNGGAASVLGGALGLARAEGDRLSIEMATGGSGADDVLASNAKILAPEVVAIEFAYWDGLEWLDSWDSLSSGTLPSAIGITLSLDTETTAEERTLAGQLQQAVTTGEAADIGEPVQIRYVIAVPLAEPYVSEASI